MHFVRGGGRLFRVIPKICFYWERICGKSFGVFYLRTNFENVFCEKTFVGRDDGAWISLAEHHGVSESHDVKFIRAVICSFHIRLVRLYSQDTV